MSYMVRARLWLSVVMICLLTACSTTSRPHTTFSEVNATPPPGLAGPDLQAWRILHTPRPARDLLQLAAQMRQITVSRVTRTTPLDEKLNAEDTFWIQTDQNTYKQITAKLIYSTPHVYDYVEDGTPTDLGALRSSADLFESSIYITNQRVFGKEWQPGVDDDLHITILNAPDLAANLSSAFDSNDEFAHQLLAYSNQREMLYMHTGDGNLAPNTDGYNEGLARAFQHMIHWNLRPSDPAWLDYGMAMLAQHINGFDAAQVDQAFLSAPNTQLTTWCADPACNPPYYGAALLFLDYFAEHYGGYSIIKQLLSDPAQAPLNFNDVLAANGYQDRFDDVFAKWVMANALNDEPQGSNGVYAYKTITNEHAQPQHTAAILPYSDQGTVHQYAAQYYDAKIPSGPEQTLHVQFAGQPTVPLLTASAPAGGSPFWWSNRGANMDATLTRSFDLTKLAGQQVQLTAALWYDLQPGRDYSYINVSTDGGKTWTPQPFNGTHGDNPNGLNLGNGVTGMSVAGDQTAWQNVTVDLAKYAGQRILVRFETVTDYGQDGQGMAVANIRVPQLADQAIPASDSGWQAQGWLNITNTLPEHYIVQAAVFATDGTIQAVVQIPVDATGQGQLDIPHLGTKVSRVLVAVSATAPATTLDASYALDLTAG